MIIVKELTKNFVLKQGVNTALKDVSFHVPTGEIVGVIGDNGAGKTTLLRIVTGVLAPTSGYVRTMRYHPIHQRNQLCQQMGVLFGKQSRLFEDNTIQQSLELEQRMYHLDNRDVKLRMMELDDIFGFSSLFNKHPKQLSLGERMRADLGMLLLRDDKLLVLDEAFLGLDILVRQNVLNFLKEKARQKGTTIVLTSHDVSDITLICNRVLVLAHATLVFYGNMDQIIKEYESHASIQFEIIGAYPDLMDLPIERYEWNNHILTIYYDSNILRTGIIIKHVLEQTQIANVKMQSAGLEEAVIGLKTKGIGKMKGER